MTLFADGSWVQPLETLFAESPMAREELDPKGSYRVHETRETRGVEYLVLEEGGERIGIACWNALYFRASREQRILPEALDEPVPDLQAVLDEAGNTTAAMFLHRLVRNPVDRYRVGAGDWTRASGETVDICNYAYWQHPQVPGYPWLRRLCDGKLVKL